MEKIVFALGNVTKDKSIKLNKPFKPNTKERFYGSQSNIGGPTATAAAVCAKLGSNVFFAGAVGDDQNGLDCKTTLNKLNINTDYIRTLNNYETPNSFIVVAPYKAISGRTIFSGRDINDLNTPPKVGEIHFNQPITGFITDGQYPDEAKAIIKDHPEMISVIDAGRATPEIIALCPLIDYVICSEEFAQKALDRKSEIDVKNDKLIKRIYIALYKTLNLDPEKNTLVITLGAEGCYYGNNKFLPAYDAVPVVDTTGAGDIFHGAFMYAILEYNDLEKALNYANVVAGLSTGKMGGIPSIPDKETITQHINPIIDEKPYQLVKKP